MFLLISTLLFSQELKKKISLKDIYAITDINGSINVEKLQVLWENLTPETNGFDWIKTKRKEINEIFNKA